MDLKKQEVISHFPIAFLMPFRNTSLPQQRPFQKKESDFEQVASVMEHKGKCHPFKTLLTREKEFLSIRQACFANRAWLNNSTSLKFKPPTSLGIQIFLFPSEVQH